MTTQWISGVHAVRLALLQRDGRVQQLLIREGRHDRRMDEVAALAAELHVNVTLASAREIDARIGHDRHQGVIAELTAAREPDESELYDLLKTLPGPALVLILDEVTDPRNFGALLRVADGAGAHAVVSTRRRAAPMTDVVHKSAAGAASHVPLFRVVNLARCLERLKREGIWIMGLADRGATPWYEADLRVPCALVVGAEGSGLRRLTRESCDVLVSLPMAGVAESLNVSVAAGIALYEAVRQRHGGA